MREKKVANNRIAYGLLKKLGYETDGMTPEQAWKALDGVPIEKLQEALRQDAAEVSSLLSAKRIVENYERQFGEIKMTPEQKIASVHIIAGQDNVLPELNEEDLAKIGVERNKPVLVKASIYELNSGKHGDVNLSEIDEIIGQTLYSQDKHIVPGKNKKGTYFVFYKHIKFSQKDGTPKYGTVLVDVSNEYDCFEVVHWHWIKEKNMQSVDPNFKQ